MAVMLGYVFYQKCVEETVTAEVFQELLHGGFREWQEEKEEEREVQQEVFHKPLDKTEGEKEWKKDNDGVPRSREELLEAFFAPEEPEEKRLVWDMKRRLLFFRDGGCGGRASGRAGPGRISAGGVPVSWSVLAELFWLALW